jgi:hypothetical protein
MRLLFLWLLLSIGITDAFAQNSLCFQYALPSGWTEKISQSPGFDTLFLYTPSNKTVQVSIQSFDYDQPELYLKSSAEQFIGAGNLQAKSIGLFNGYAIEGLKEWHYLFLCKSADNEDRLVTIAIILANEWEPSESKALKSLMDSFH